LLRIRVLLTAALSAVILSIFTPPAEAGPRRQMVKAINYVRGWGHIRRLRSSPRLARSAERWARHLAQTDVLQHGHAQGEVIEFHTGSSPDVDGTVGAWMRSPAHRAVMLARQFHRVGAGRAVGTVNGRPVTVWVVRFAV
jgi:uncharacterized protein YkwD